MVIQEIWKGYISEVKRDYFSARMSCEDSKLDVFRIKKTSIIEEERDRIFVGADIEMYVPEDPNESISYYICKAENLTEEEVQKIRDSDELYIEIFEDDDVQKLLKGYDDLVLEVEQSILILTSHEEKK